MDPTPFNFNSSANTTGNNQTTSSSFSTTGQKTSFGSLFGRPSTLNAFSKKEAEKNENSGLAPSSSLASRLSVLPKTMPPRLEERGDRPDSKVPDLQEGLLATRPRQKPLFGQLPGLRRPREGTPEESKLVPKNPFAAKPIKTTFKPTGFTSFRGPKNAESKSIFEEPLNTKEGVDETDHVAQAPSSSSNFPFASSAFKGFQVQENRPPPAKHFADRTWKPQSRSSPAPDTKVGKPSGSDEASLVRRLATLKGQVCPGDYEKYVLLDERDKILCQLREIDSPLIRRLERCEEMCIEKERYQRIVQKGVSPFECDEETGEVSHEMMVKQYARSAADQERPLPHELRTEKIMNYTMCYLLHNVLDQLPDTSEQRAAWYNFLWNRTRALRKEVTQLSLSDSLALNLVERCTRMHILFGYVLCDLEIEHFDAAMNNETLGKCLQTLRHLYEDFEKRGIPCVNESEFRSYDVMLHMNDTNVLSQVLSYRNEIRQSEAVRLALQLASAFRDKNYCRFFRLLKSKATFLQCCVAHKLFSSARSSAISIMVNSYGRSMYPLEKLRNTLAFDNLEDLTTMLNIFGLRIEQGSDQVLLTRDDLTLTKSAPLQNYEWIDEKHSGKLSQVVYGLGLFQFIASRCDVSNSFNHRNEYVNDKVLEMVLSGSDIPISTDSFAQSAGSYISQETSEHQRKLEADRIKKIENEKREKLIEKLMFGVVDQVVQGIAEEEAMKMKMVRRKLKAMEKARLEKEENARKQQELENKRKEMEEDVARSIAAKIEKDVAEKELEQLIMDEFRMERRKSERQLAHIIVEKFWREILKSVDHRVHVVCREAVNEKETILEGLEVFRNNISRQWLSQFWNRWREWVQIKKESRSRKFEMIRRCVPRWESEELANSLSKRFDQNQSSPPADLLDRPKHIVKLTVFLKSRRNRLVRDAFSQWREYAKKRKVTRKLAEEQQKRQNNFFERFEKCALLETRFKFDAPQDWMKAKQRKVDNVENSERLNGSQNRCISGGSLSNCSTIVARRHLEEWEPEFQMPSELKDKLKRKRELLEKACEEHTLKKKKEEEFLSMEAKKNNDYIATVSGEANSLLDETLRYTADLEEIIRSIRSRKVDDL